MDKVPHEYGPSKVGHGEAQCKWCFGTNRENAIIAPNHCDSRAKHLTTLCAEPAPVGGVERALSDRRAQNPHEPFIDGNAIWDEGFCAAWSGVRAALSPRVDAVDNARDAFLNMIADATRWDEDVDGDRDDDGRPIMTIDYHLTIGHSQLQELCDALGIKAKGYDETLKEAIDAAISAPPTPEPGK